MAIVPANKSNSTKKAAVVPTNKKASMLNAKATPANSANSKKKFVPFAKKGK